jgi:hypothetical protein
VSVTLKQAIADAALTFRTKVDASALTDREIRLAIKALREVLLFRQQQRASEKIQKTKGANS